MSRRKRASMREGPLADLFRSTAQPDEQPTESQPSVPPPDAGEGETGVLPAADPPAETPEADRALLRMARQRFVTAVIEGEDAVTAVSQVVPGR